MISYTKIAISNPYNVLDYCLRINSPTHGDAYRLNNISIILLYIVFKFFYILFSTSSFYFYFMTF